MAAKRAVSKPKLSHVPSVNLDRVAEHVPAMIAVYNVQTGEYAYINDAIKKLLGYKPNDFIEKGLGFVTSIVHPDDLNTIMDKNQTAFAIAEKAKPSKNDTRPVISFEYRMRHANGSWVWLHTDSSIYDRNDDGSIRHVLNVSIDINNQKNTELKLVSLTKQLEERYQAFIQNSNEGIWRFELNQPIPVNLTPARQIKLMYERAYLAEANDALAKMYGFRTSKSLIGLRLDEFLIKDDPQNMEYLTAFIRSGYKLSGVESHEVDRNGRDKFFRNSLVGLVQDGKVIRAWGTQQDITEQHQASEALKESEERLKLAMKASRMGVWEWNVNSDKLTWSNELKSIFGLKNSTVVTYEKYMNLLHPEDRPKLQKVIQNAQRTGRKYSIEHRTIWPDGSIHWILGMGQAFIENGKLVRMAGVSLDIDQRKRSDEQFRRQTQYLEALNETALEIGKGLKSPDAILKIILKRSANLAGTSDGYIYILNDKQTELTVQVAIGVFKQYIGHSMKKGEGLAGKVWKSGKHIAVENYDSWSGRQKSFPKGVLKAAIGVPLKSEGKVIGIIALGYDKPRKVFPQDELIALNRLADIASIGLYNAGLYQESQERKDRFMNLADSAPVLIWMAGPDKLCTYFNKTWLRFTGRKLKDELGDGWIDSIHPDDREKCIDVYYSAFDLMQPFDSEYRLRHYSGEYRWVLDKGIPRYSAEGEFLGYIGSCIDIEDLKSATERRQELEAITATLTEQHDQLVALNNAKDEFISLASHQLRTPATGVKQFIGMLLENYFGELADDQHTMLEYAYESNERQLEVINDLLKVAQVDSGKIVLIKQKCDLAEMLEDIMHEQRAQFDRRQQRIILDRPKKPVVASVDPARMRMVIENLIDNASKYTPDGKKISVSIHEPNAKKFITVKIKDEGVGIAGEDMPKLFQKFSRLDNPLSIQVGGTGIGLYWAKKIVDLHGGAIVLKSKPAQGTTFIVRIPA